MDAFDVQNAIVNFVENHATLAPYVTAGQLQVSPEFPNLDQETPLESTRIIVQMDKDETRRLCYGDTIKIAGTTRTRGRVHYYQMFIWILASDRGRRNRFYGLLSDIFTWLNSITYNNQTLYLPLGREPFGPGWRGGVNLDYEADQGVFRKKCYLTVKVLDTKTESV